jgi:hypothetical protein
METIMANIRGAQREVRLSTWEEIHALGFKKRDRAFGSLNDGTPALFFYKHGLTELNVATEYDWCATTEKLEDIND